MTVRVLFFSVLRDITDSDEVVMSVGERALVSDLLGLCFERWPRLKPWDESLLVAVDQRYVRRETGLHDRAEVAIMPPVQGG